jgi:hypothetical protein
VFGLGVTPKEALEIGTQNSAGIRGEFQYQPPIDWLKNTKQRTKLYYMEQLHTYLHYFST